MTHGAEHSAAGVYTEMRKHNSVKLEDSNRDKHKNQKTKQRNKKEQSDLR